ncbi:MAG TPA: nucleotide sugar dehydrogenase, partial [Candidatus Tectomicrobia bacterium]|nr:nucleotide sugar dehydrogenase [Candidatus Tectomicrobia bacterium]
DVDGSRVAAVNAGCSPVAGVPADGLGAVVAARRLHATEDVTALKDADAIVVCVPVPLGMSRTPDIAHVAAAADAVASVLRPGQLVVLESTAYPGTTREVLRPRVEARGLCAGEDVFLACSPARLDPGDRRRALRDVPKVVGGITPTCRALAAALYGRLTRVVEVSSPEAAEMVKLLETTFRAVNIALVNEVTTVCRRLGLDVWEVADAAATKPFGFMPFQPGPGLGGHAVPSDPAYRSWCMRLEGSEPRFIALADEINRRMPEHVLQLLADALNDRGRAVRGARVLVLGVAYQADVADTRDSPALEVLAGLARRGTHVAYHDPHVPHVVLPGGARLESLDGAALDLRAWDAVLILTAHAGTDWARVVREAPLVVDARNATGRLGRAPNVVRL